MHKLYFSKIGGKANPSASKSEFFLQTGALLFPAVKLEWKHPLFQGFQPAGFWTAPTPLALLVSKFRLELNSQLQSICSCVIRERRHVEIAFLRRRITCCYWPWSLLEPQ